MHVFGVYAPQIVEKHVQEMEEKGWGENGTWERGLLVRKGAYSLIKFVSFSTQKARGEGDREEKKALRKEREQRIGRRCVHTSAYGKIRTCTVGVQ